VKHYLPINFRENTSGIFTLMDYTYFRNVFFATSYLIGLYINLLQILVKSIALLFAQ